MIPFFGDEETIFSALTAAFKAAVNSAIALFRWSRLKYDFKVVLYKHARCLYNSMRRVIISGSKLRHFIMHL